MSVLEQCKEVYKKDQQAWQRNYDKSANDLLFLSDDEYAQWDQKDYAARVRTGRPALTIDQLNQFVHQVANDIRMNTPTINVLPSDVEASEETAEVLKGLIREIEYRSLADDVYDTASLSSVKCALGFIRIDHDYDGDGFEQVLEIKRVVNPLNVWLDSDSIECDGRDAKHCTIIDHITVEEFKKRYPEKTPSSFGDDDFDASQADDDDYVSIAEVFKVEETEEEITSEDGKITRIVTRRKVNRYKMSGDDILEETEFPSRYIPMVPVYGEEAWVDGKRQLYSLIRRSKQAQRMFNLWKSLETELLMKAPKAPIMAAVGQVEDFQEDWKNPDKAAVLRYHAVDSSKNLIGPPQRIEPPPIPVGVVNAARQTVDDIKATMGIYNAGLGMPSNELSGVAIHKRQGESDTATYHFADNLVRSITQVGRILIDAIPNVYDTPRVLRIVGVEEDVKRVGVNGQVIEDQPETVDLTAGRYDVRVTTGASYSTRRQEAADFLSQLVTTNPEFMKIMGDKLFENLDVTGAPAMAERIKRVMDPAILQEDDGVDPAVMALQQQMQQMQGVIASQQEQLQSKQAELSIKAQSEQNDAAESAANVQVDREKLQLDRDKFVAEVALKERELALEEQKFAIQVAEKQVIPPVQLRGE